MTIKQIWEWLCMLLFALPFAIVGYFAAFCVNGLVTGYNLSRHLHKPVSNKTSP